MTLRLNTVSKALHVFHGRGYCTMGKHNPTQNYLCLDEARAVLAALDGLQSVPEYPTSEPALTLSARQEKQRGRRRA